MQRITIKDQNGAILAVLHAMNCTIKETNGVSVDIDGGLRTINTPHSHPISPPKTGPAGRQLIQIVDDKFITSDGYELHHEGNIWTDGDLSFLADREGHPIDCDGNRLEGHYKVPDEEEEYCTKCEQHGHQAINCHFSRDM